MRTWEAIRAANKEMKSKLRQGQATHWFVSMHVKYKYGVFGLSLHGGGARFGEDGGGARFGEDGGGDSFGEDGGGDRFREDGWWRQVQGGWMAETIMRGNCATIMAITEGLRKLCHHNGHN